MDRKQNLTPSFSPSLSNDGANPFPKMVLFFLFFGIIFFALQWFFLQHFEKKTLLQVEQKILAQKEEILSEALKEEPLSLSPNLASSSPQGTQGTPSPLSSIPQEKMVEYFAYQRKLEKTWHLFPENKSIQEKLYNIQRYLGEIALAQGEFMLARLWFEKCKLLGREKETAKLLDLWEEKYKKGMEQKTLLKDKNK